MIFLKKFLKYAIVVLMVFSFFKSVSAEYKKKIYDFKIESLTGDSIDFSKHKNKAILLVNVASKCGFTNQYTDLQKLWDTYRDEGLLVVGFPSNQFGGQEPESNLDIKKFCETNFNINFPMTAKIDVKGENATPIYKWAKENYGNAAVPKWNFYKILINNDGTIFNTYSSITKPLSSKLITDIEKIIN